MTAHEIILPAPGSVVYVIPVGNKPGDPGCWRARLIRIVDFNFHVQSLHRGDHDTSAHIQRVDRIYVEQEFSGIDTPPDDQRHVEQVISHIAHLDDDQVEKIRKCLNQWANAARRDDGAES